MAHFPSLTMDQSLLQPAMHADVGVVLMDAWRPWSGYANASNMDAPEARLRGIRRDVTFMALSSAASEDATR